MFCTQDENKNPDGERDNFVRFIGVFLVIMITTGGGFYIWSNYFSEMGRARRMAQEQTRTYEKAEAAYIKAMTEDTHGGKNPQETLDMFVDALKKGDVDLASKYFLLKEEDGFRRDKWVRLLTEVKNRNLLIQLASDIENQATPLISEDNNRSSFGFFENGAVISSLDLIFNRYSNIWKIESL